MCVSKAEDRDVVAVRVFWLLAKGKIIFPHVILCSLIVERTALATRPELGSTTAAAYSTFR
jgi:hypothetical protein